MLWHCDFCSLKLVGKILDRLSFTLIITAIVTWYSLFPTTSQNYIKNTIKQPRGFQPLHALTIIYTIIWELQLRFKNNNNKKFKKIKCSPWHLDVCAHGDEDTLNPSIPHVRLLR